ncbi:MAG: hypothetical protein O2782_23275 [bacterium]|nr:hypothetical protein [bacterium]
MTQPMLYACVQRYLDSASPSITPTRSNSAWVTSRSRSCIPAPGTFQARPDAGVIDFPRLVRRMLQDGYDGVMSVEFVTTQDMADWDMPAETARLKQILEDALG